MPDGRGACGPQQFGTPPTAAGRACGGQDIVITVRHACAANKKGGSVLLAIKQSA